MSHLVEIRRVGQAALVRFRSRGARLLGASVAFYCLVSAAPLLVLVLRAVSAVFGRARAESTVWNALGTWLLPEGIDALRGLTQNLERTSASGAWVPWLLLLYTSSRLFRVLHLALNQLWADDPTVVAPGGRVTRYGLRAGRALLLTGMVVALVAALILIKGAAATVSSLDGRGPGVGLLVVDVTASVGFAFVLFWALFCLLPEVRVPLGIAAKSAALSTALFAVGSELVTLYLHVRRPGDVYAGASALVVAVVWVYYSAQVFFFGACVGAVLSHEAAGNHPAT